MVFIAFVNVAETLRTKSRNNSVFIFLFTKGGILWQ